MTEDRAVYKSKNMDRFYRDSYPKPNTTKELNFINVKIYLIL